MIRFLPGRHAIESFGNGGFRLGGVSHHGAICITPSGVRALPIHTVAGLTDASLGLVLAEKNEIDIFLIGTGKDMSALPNPLALALHEAGMGFDIMTTNAAVRIYNVVHDENRRVAAILMAVDKAYG